MAGSEPIGFVKLCDADQSTTFREIADQIKDQKYPLKKEDICKDNSSVSVTAYKDGSLLFAKTIFQDKKDPQDRDYTVIERQLKVLKDGRGSIVESRTSVQAGNVNPRLIQNSNLATDLRFDRKGVKKAAELIKGKN